MATELDTVGAAVRERRELLGLSQTRLAHLSGLSRQTLSGLESGTLHDLGFNRVAQLLNVLGLNSGVPNAEMRNRKKGLWMAAKTASVSYKEEMDTATLSRALVTGQLPKQFIAHVARLLDEAPIPVIVMAVEEAARNEHVQPKAVWRNISKLAKSLDLSRKHALA